MQRPDLDRLPSSKRSSRHWIGSVVIWMAAAIVVATFLVRGPACGADFAFHFGSWHDVVNSWHQAIPYPHWATSANFGAGEPRLVFYPPLTWLLGAALGLLLPWTFVPIAVNFLLLTATGFATRALARKRLSEGPATLAGATAIFSGYTLYEVYFHSDFALLSGGAWFPLLLLLLLDPRDVRGLRAGNILNRYTLPLALVVAGMWLSNAPLGLMACYVTAGLSLTMAVQERSPVPLMRNGIAIGLGLGLAGFYLVSAVSEQPWVDIVKLFARPDHLIQNRWITSELRGPYQRARGFIEVYMLLLAIGGAATVWRRGRWPSKQHLQERRWWFALLLLTLTILFLMFPISRPVWDVLPRLRYLEYPWRWLVVLQAPMAVFFAAAIWPTNRHRQTLVVTLCALFFLSYDLVASTNKRFFLPCGTYYSLANLERALQPGAEGVGGTDEYASPPNASNGLIPIGLPDACLVSDPLLVLSDVLVKSSLATYASRVWSPGLGTCAATFSAEDQRGRPEHLHLVAQIQKAGYLVLRLRSYPAWKVVVNGQQSHNLPRRADGLIAVPVPQGRVDLTVDWVATSDVLLGRWLSGISMLLAMLLWWNCNYGSRLEQSAASSRTTFLTAPR